MILLSCIIERVALVGTQNFASPHIFENRVLIPMLERGNEKKWIPAFAGMTVLGISLTDSFAGMTGFGCFEIILYLFYLF